MNTITIDVPFDLNQICNSGQCFRCELIKDDIFRFIYLNNVLYIKHISGDRYEISVSENAWNSIWVKYFDLNSNYHLADTNNEFLRQAIKFGNGIRILNQDPFEMLISYIISQQKSIPQIKKAVNNISIKYGDKIVTEHETVYSFPNAKRMYNVTLDDLQEFKLGYRTKYLFRRFDQTERWFY